MTKTINEINHLMSGSMHAADIIFFVMFTIQISNIHQV